MNYFLYSLKHYADFKGRARRKEFWMFCLFETITLLILILIDNVLGITFDNLPYGFFYLIGSLALIIPFLAVSCRRLHDINKRGSWLLIGLIPIIGSIWLFVLWCIEGDAGENQYGPNPKNNKLMYEN